MAIKYKRIRKLKRNNYMILPHGIDDFTLIVCLGIQKSKLFDHNLGYRQKDNTIKWIGRYKKNKNGWIGLVERCQQLHDLEIIRDYELEREHGYNS